jgi:PST family polysaccharide transporter
MGLLSMPILANGVTTQVVKRLGANVSILVAERIVRLLVVIVVGSCVARYLGPASFGLYSAALSLTTLFGNLADCGTVRIVVQRLATHDGSPGVLVGTALAIRVLGGLVFGILATVCAWLFLSENDALAVGLAVIFAISWLARLDDSLTLVFQASSRMHLAALARLVGLIGGGVLQLVLIQANAGILALASGTIVDAVFASIAAYWMFRVCEPSETRLRPSADVAWNLAAQGGPILAAGFFSNIYLRFDQVMVAQLAGDAQAGQFAASNRIYDVLMGFVPLLTVAMAPEIARLYKRGPKVFLKAYCQLTSVVTLVFAVGLIGAWLIRDRLVLAVFGTEYAAAGDILAMQMLSAGICYSLLLRSQYLILSRQGGVLMWTSLLGAVTSVLANLWLIPRYGAIGAAMGSVLTQFVALYASNALFAKARWLLLAHAGLYFLVDETNVAGNPTEELVVAE